MLMCGSEFVKKCKKNWLYIKHWLNQTFCLVTNLKFSLLSACKSVNRVGHFSADSEG